MVRPESSLQEYFPAPCWCSSNMKHFLSFSPHCRWWPCVLSWCWAPSRPASPLCPSSATPPHCHPHPHPPLILPPPHSRQRTSTPPLRVGQLKRQKYSTSTSTLIIKMITLFKVVYKRKSVRLCVCVHCSPFPQPPLLQRRLPIGGEFSGIGGGEATVGGPHPHPDEPLHSGRAQQPDCRGRVRPQVREQAPRRRVYLVSCRHPHLLLSSLREPTADGASEVFWRSLHPWLLTSDPLRTPRPPESWTRISIIVPYLWASDTAVAPANPQLPRL